MSPDEQRRALDGLHALIEVADDERQRSLLETGYIPRLREPLIDAAARTLCMLGSTRAGLSDEKAVARLGKIVTQLRKLKGDRQAKAAVDAIEARIGRVKSLTMSGWDWLGLAGILAVFALLCAAGLKLVWLFLRWLAGLFSWIV